MALHARDVVAGAIAYLDYLVLREHPEVDDGRSNINRDGPFLCVQVAGDRCCWVPLTSQARPERLLLRKEWRSGGSPKLRTTDLYVNDGLNTFVGPVAAFVEAGAEERAFTSFPRPCVSAAGVLAALDEIDRQGGPLAESRSGEGRDA